MRLALGGGGSGGHVFPALAVAQSLSACTKDKVELLYLGRATGVEATLARDAGVPFRDVSARPVRDRNIVAQLWSLGRWRWASGTRPGRCAASAPTPCS